MRTSPSPQIEEHLMADSRRPAASSSPGLAPGLASLCEDAQALAATYPAPPQPVPSTWHPAPLAVSPGARRLGENVPPFI